MHDVFFIFDKQLNILYIYITKIFSSYLLNYYNK